MKVKIKKLNEDAIIPKYAKSGDAGLDLTATSAKISNEFGYIEYGTGLSIEIPKGYVGLIFPRSSISNTNMMMSNSVGVVDENYRGELKVRMYDFDSELDESKETLMGGEFCYEVGHRIAQLIIIPYPQIEFEEVTDLSETERNDAGFGSSGK